MMKVSVLLTCSVVISVPHATSLSYSSFANLGRSSISGSSAGAAIAKIQLGQHQHQQWIQKQKRIPEYLTSTHATRTTVASATSLHLALGGNYLENINEDSSDNKSDINDNNSNDGEKRWGFFGNGASSNNNNSQVARGNGGGGRTTGGGRGVGTAIRPSPPNGAPENTMSNNGNNGRVNNAVNAPGTNYGLGGNRRQQPPGGNGNGNNGGVPKVFSIRQPQDLLDFVIRDERLSVVKVYASWCKTCAVFDVRYRKLASQLGDNSASPEPGRVRFAEMQFDDPNNEEMCRLLNATKLPYILIYKGSKGKVDDFQCGPAKFQMLLDAVNEYADPVGDVASSAAAAGGFGTAAGGEQEWRVVREQQQKRNQEMRMEQRDAQYGGAGSIANYPPPSVGDGDAESGRLLKLKDEEIARLYSELSNLRKDFDRRIVQLKEEHKKETSTMSEQILEQTKEYEKERRALSVQIEDLSREMMEREKSYRSDDSAESQRLRGEMKQKEEEYKKTLTEMNLRITELEQDLFKSRNELRYNTDASSNDQRQLQIHITSLETEITNLTSRNEKLENELIEEKRVVVASTEEASRVLKQLQKIKSSEDEERRALASRIVELEEEIADRGKQIQRMNNAAVNSMGDRELAGEIQQELDRLKKEHERERELMSARIAELEAELSASWQSASSTNVDSEREIRQLQRESERLSDRILELENEIDERDKLLRTSNKAADILLDNMESQKREFEGELERTANLVNGLEEAIQGREEEMGMLQERFDALERMAEELKGREDEREREQGERAAADGFQFGMSQQQQQQQQSANGDGSDQWDNENGRWQMEHQARLAAEQEVGKLMGEISRMQQQPQQNEGPKSPFSFGALFGGNDNSESGNGWDWNNNENNEESMDGYEMLKDVLMPDEVSPRGGVEPAMPWSGAGRFDNVREGSPPPGEMGGRSENIWEGAGLSSFMSSSSSSPSGAGRSDNIRDGAGSASFGGATPSPSVSAYEPSGQLPTPAMAFERRLAENPIVPAGAFGGSKPTASFFSSSPTRPSPAGVPSDTPDYYQNAMSNFNGNGGDANTPAMPPAASYEQRPTMPSPRTSASTGMSDNIYAGAGSASSSSSSRRNPSYPSPAVSPRVEPAAPLPTPAMAFEKRLAENPIVPSGAFGGSQPTARFFSATPAPSPGGTATMDNYNQSSPPPEDDSQSKWQRLDDFEKKRVAADAYKAFEKSLEDGRRDMQSKKPKGGNAMGMGMGGRGAAGRGDRDVGGRGAGASENNKRPAGTTAASTKGASKGQSSQVELERKKHQEMVKGAAAAAKEKTRGSPTAATNRNDTQKQQQQQQQQRSAQQIQASAVQASAKRMSLAERAAKADQDRKDRQKQMKAEARQAREAQQTENIQRLAEAKRREGIKRAEELKLKADADLASAKQLSLELEREKNKSGGNANVDGVEQQRVKAKEQSGESPAAMKNPNSDTPSRSAETKERIEAALLGADEEASSTANSDAQQATKQKQQQQNGNSGSDRKPATPNAVAGGSGFAVSSKKYDVVVLKDTKKNAINMPQLLEGSLKDLLKDGPPPKRRRNASGDSNY